MPRGGAREGKPGASYANRTDLQAVKVAPGQQYGKGAEQRRAQQALPLAGATSPGPSAPPAPSRPPMAQMPSRLPGSLTPLDAPTTRPNEPLTAGMDIGPGGGRELLGALGQSDNGVEDLAQWLPMLEHQASQPGVSRQMRNFVRSLRASAPTEQ